MKKILNIVTSINGSQSYSNQLSKAILDKITTAHPEHSIKTLDFSQQSFPHIEGFQVGSFYTPDEMKTPEQHQAVSFSDQAVNDLLEADIVVIGVPVYNFHVPSSLKSWIDHVARAGLTFQYIDGAPKGMATGKKVYLAIASGAVYSEGPLRELDFSEPYLRAVLGFIGMTDITVFRVEGVKVASLKDTAIPKAIEAVNAYAFA